MKANSQNQYDLTAAEPDAKRRADYGGLAVVFAEAADRQAVWKEALKEWNMVESQQVLEWMTEAEIKTQIKNVLRLLEKKFPPGPPAELAATIKECTDLNRLARWFDAAIDANSLEDFRRALN